MFRKLKRIHSNGYCNYIPNFDKNFPELKKVSSEEMTERWRKLGIVFYSEIPIPVKPFMRFTLPFAILLLLIMIIGMPVLFLVTGSWKYPLSDKSKIYNWFRELKLFK